MDNPAHTFLVTSAGAGEGKSLTAANLAVVFAQSGQKVLLIDSDLRRPSLQRLFDIDRDYGLTNVLIGESTLEDVRIEIDAVPGLYVIPTGPLPPNPADLLDSERMNHIIEQAKKLADVVFFDSPPAIVLTDAVLLSAKIDQTLLVAECEHVSRTAFQEMVRLIRQARGSVLGAVLNKLRLSSSDYYYYYYYYYDYTRQTPTRRGPGPVQRAQSSETESITNDLFDDAALHSEDVPEDAAESVQQPAYPDERSESDMPAIPEDDKTTVEDTAVDGEERNGTNGTKRKNGNNNKLLDDLLGINGDDQP